MISANLPHWELSVLSRAVAYRNLSGAAGNIGISQPQLSRIVSRLEESVGVALLDRSSRRNSSWTPAAFKLAELYASSSATLEKQLQSLAGSNERRQLKLGVLEGLAPLATSFCHSLFSMGSIELIELDVHDVHVLEELFFKGELDLLFSSRLPGRKKPRYSRLLGYQSLERVATDARMHVLSPFERATHKDTAGREVAVPSRGSRALVSNSLAVRRRWLENFGGTGLVPTSVRQKVAVGADSKALAVYLVGVDSLPKEIWAKVADLKVP